MTSRTLSRPLGAPVSVKKLPAPLTTFPPAWPWFVDEILPGFVKQNYSPRESWKNKPFTRDDVRFFSKGVTELSELFTEERPERVPAYFQHPKFRSAYLLYFLPFQMAKFVTLFEIHSKAFETALDHGRKQGVLRIADLGAGPGTASLAFLLRLLQQRGEIPPVELIWFDTQRHIMEDGVKLVQSISDQFPRLRGKVVVKTHVANWWEAPAQLPGNCSLILLGHVLNEARELPHRFRFQPEEEFSEEFTQSFGRDGEVETIPGTVNHVKDQKPAARLEPVWKSLLDQSAGAGVLIVEPASRATSHFLSRLRNRLFENEAIPASATSLWGPCPHAETCPLSTGKDWCHFSVPVRVPGKWFAEFSKSLGSERQWLKFSYLWLTSVDQRSPRRDPNLKLVISDPLSKAGDVLICEPEKPGRISTASIGPVWRGDVLQVKKGIGSHKASNSHERPIQPKRQGKHSRTPDKESRESRGAYPKPLRPSKIKVRKVTKKR